MKHFFSEDTTPFSQQRLYGREVCKIYKCPICGGDIDSFVYDLKKYAYKVMHKGKIKVMRVGIIGHPSAHPHGHLAGGGFFQKGSPHHTAHINFKLGI